MKNFIRNILFFLAAAFIGYVLFLALLALALPPEYANQFNINYKNTVGHSFTRLNEVKQVENIDILFIGPSTSYMGFDPRIFKKHCITTFNLGTSAQSPVQTNVLLNRYLNQLNPKLVVYDPLPGNFERKGLESATDLISNDVIDEHLLNMMYEYTNPIVWNTLFYSLINRLLKTDRFYTQDRVERFDTYIGRGYVSRSEDVRLGENDSNSDHRSTESWEPLSFQQEYFKKNIELLKENETEFILIEIPKRSISGLEQDLKKLEIDSYLRNFETYINYHYLIDMKSEHFADNTHLNQKGVEFFNSKILKRPEFQKFTCH